MTQRLRFFSVALAMLACLACPRAWAGALPEADLAVTNSNGVTFVDYRGSARSLVRVTNLGPAAAPAPVLTWTPGSGYEVQAMACSATPGSCVVAPTASQLATGFVLPALAAGAFHEIAIDVNVVFFQAQSTAQVAAGAGVVDPVAGNNQAVDADGVGFVPFFGPDLALSIASARDRYIAGIPLDYTLQLVNAGPGPSVGGGFSQTLPAGTSFVALAAPSGFTCTTPAVGAAGSLSCSAVSMPAGSAEFAVRIATDTATGPMLLQATAGSFGLEVNYQNNFGGLTLDQFVAGPSAPRVVPALSTWVLALAAGLLLLGARRGRRC